MPIMMVAVGIPTNWIASFVYVKRFDELFSSDRHSTDETETDGL